MKQAMLGILAVVGLVAAVFCTFGPGDQAMGQQHGAAVPAAGGGDLIVVPMPSAEKGQVLSIVDPRGRTLCVYRVDPVTGKIALKSARNLNWDLQISHYNNDAPLPQEIQSLLQQR
ncbi:MAG: hypothetical protein IT426_14595 [Pirellulales bacterium]|nr:hypothetical protein [Pirellulales bacterium]